MSGGFIKDHYRVFGDVESMIIGLRIFMQTNIFVSVISVLGVIIIIRFILSQIFQVFFYFEFRVFLHLQISYECIKISDLVHIVSYGFYSATISMINVVAMVNVADTID